MGKKSDKKQSKAAARNDEDMQVPDDERFTSVLSAPVFKNLSKEKHKVEIDDRFKGMLTDDRFKVLPGGSVDAYGRKKNKKAAADRALEELYHVDEDDNGDDDDEGDDPQSTSAKDSKKKNQAPKGGKAEMEKRLDYLTKLARGEVSDDGSEDDSSDEDGSEGEDEDDEDEGDEVMEVDPAEWEAIQLLNGKSPLDVPEEEDVETGEATRRISILNCDWENIKADDLMMILQSFCPPGRQVQTITVYPSDFGKQRMAEEAKYGPRGIWKSDEEQGEMSEMEESDGEDEDSNAENESLYDQIEANEGLEDGDDDNEEEEEEQEEEESEEEQPAPKKGTKGKKGYGEFNRKQGAVGLVLHDELVQHKHKKKAQQPESEEEDEEGEEEEEDSEGEDEDNEEDDDEENGSGVYSGSRNSGSKKSKSDYNAVALRQYELSKLRYYFAIAECDSVDTANALYEALDGVEFENSAMALEIRFVPDDLDLSDREVRDKCSHAPDARRYKPPEFVVNAKQHTNVTCTWDEGEKDREKTLTNFSAWRNLKESDFAQYLASESEDDGEESEEEEEEEAADSDDQSAGDAGKSVKSSADRKKEKARALRKMLLGDDGSSDDDDSAHDDFFNESLGDSDADSGDEVIQKTAASKPSGKAKSKSTSVDELGENDELVMSYVPEAEKDQVLQRKREREGGLTPYEIEMAKSADKKKSRKAARKSAVEEKIRREKDEELMRQEQLKKERKLRKEKGEEIDAEDLVESYRGRMQQQSKDMQQERKKKVNKKTPLTAIEDDLDRKQQQNTHRAVVTDASFTVDTKDDRFARVFTGDAKFGIDRTAPEFRATPGMKKILAEQRKRRQDEETHRSSTTPPVEVDTSKPAAKKARVEESTTSAAAPSTNVDVNFLANKLKSKFQKK